jgi:hypothetical protein
MALVQVILVASEAAPGLLQWVWTEVDYRLDVCCVTKGGHIENLRGMQRKLGEFLCLSICRVLQLFPPFKCTDFMKCVRDM